MKRSTDRIITTHVGSLARLPEVIAPMKARESGASVDQAAFAKAVKSAVETVVKKQVELGIDVRQRRRAEQDELQQLHHGAPDRLRAALRHPLRRRQSGRGVVRLP